MKFFVGLLLGFALGVAAGLLLAPQSGEATLAQLGEQGITLRDRSGGLTDLLRSRPPPTSTQFPYTTRFRTKCATPHKSTRCSRRSQQNGDASTSSSTR